MKVDIGVGGRFHAERMAAAFVGAGHEVRFATSLPRSRLRNVPPEVELSIHLWPELVFRASRLVGLDNFGDVYKMRAFGRAIAAAFSRGGRRDLFFGWSGYALETLRLAHAERRFVVRDSAHIQFQSRILEDEYARLGLRYPDRRVPVQRELDEYEAATGILVCSEFARRTFVEAGVAAEKLRVLPLASDTSLFRPPSSFAVELPLRVIYFGNVSVQKGVLHLLEATADFSPNALELTIVGHVDSDVRPLLRRYSHAKWHGPEDQGRLAETLRHHHVFVFPTLHDGFGQVLPQAMASGLLPIATENCGAVDWITSGVNGVRIAAGDAGAIRRELLALVDDPKRVEAMRAKAAARGASRGWEAYGADLLAIAGGERDRARVRR